MTQLRGEPSRSLFWALVASTLLYLLALPFAAMMAMMSPMASDSRANAETHLFIATAMTLPFALVLSPALAWIAYRLRWNGAAGLLILLPLAWAPVLVGIISP
jgi:ABC-type sulfate transport system permease subunit